jgi:hypothetical protein
MSKSSVGSGNSELPISQIQDATAEWSSLDLISNTAEKGSSARLFKRIVPATVVSLVGLGALFTVGMTTIRGNIQDSLTTKSRASLKAAAIEGVDVSFYGRDGEVRIPVGMDPTKVRRAVLTADAASDATHFSGPRRLNVIVDPSMAPPPSSAAAPTPRDITAQVDSKGAVHIEGVLKSQEAKDVLLAAVKSQAPSAPIEDRTTIGPGGVEPRTALWAGKAVGELRRVGAFGVSVIGSTDGLAKDL